MRLGIDFDNTIVSYDEVFADVAVRLGLIPAGFRGDKTAVRDHIRSLEDGEARWTALQALVYGPHIGGAKPFEGFLEFLAAAQVRGIPVHIVSHKSEYAAAAPNGVNLREAARRWLEEQGIVGGSAWIAPDSVYFEGTRDAKVARIAELGCTHFIDDLVEVFDEPAFPAGVVRYLFAPGGAAVSNGRYRVVRDWRQLAKELF